MITLKPPLSSVECDWASMIPNNVKERDRTSQSCSEAWWVPRDAWLNIQKRRQSWLDRHQSWLRMSNTARRRSTTVVERRWRQSVACSRNSTASPIRAALVGDWRRCQYVYLQLSTIDDARPRSMTAKYFTCAPRRTAPPLLAPSGARWRSPTVVSALCGAQLRSSTVCEPPLSADKNRQCVIVKALYRRYRLMRVMLQSPRVC